jgi:DNA polymerase-3 subunit alpha
MLDNEQGNAAVDSGFVHLHLHSEYSLVDGIVRIKPLMQAVAGAAMPAVALTDQANMFAMVKFYKAAMAAGIKPIIGADVWLRNPEDASKPYRMVLLVKDAVGYKNLTRLVSRGYQEGQHLGAPMLERGWIAEAQAGLIVLSGGRDGDVGQALLAGNGRRAAALLDAWLALFGDRYYLEVVRTGREHEEEYLHLAVELAARRGVPMVASNDVRFLSADDFDAHETRVCIHDGRTLDDPRRKKLYSAQQYLRTPREMAELFVDLPEALENSVEIAKRCTLELELGKNYLPDFPTPPGMSLDDFLRAQAQNGLEQRLQRILNPGAADYASRREAYAERLQVELDVIIQMGFPGYFLIVADFIQWSKDNGIPVGPGRGSGAGSLVAYALKITDIDPLPFDLLFERFLNPERVSMPDFDVDFCMDNRDKVIDYVADKYGRDAVSQIITYGTMAAKAVVRDVGRVMGHPYGFVDRIAKLVPFEVGMTLKRALEESDELRQAYRGEEEVGLLIDMALSLEGIARNAGKHAGGVVIAPGKLTDFSPLYCEPSGESLVTQFDKDDVEQVGLVKFDFLGLRTLTIIDWALKTINAQRAEQGQAPLDINALPMDDKASFDLLKRAETTAVFQLESRGMKELIKKLQPDCFEDIVALVALYRPGPLGSGMVDDFIARKKGTQKVDYPHPDLEPVLKPTYGTILYQEQVMQIAQVLAGYSLGGADLLRRAMGKKKQEVMDQQRAIFVKGAVENGVEQSLATHIFDLMAEFAKYGFNKSHSAAYALVSFQTAWLKAHHPAAFMAAVLSSDMDNTDKVVIFIEECRQMRLRVDPPDVNRSDYMFTVDGDNAVVYGLGAIKGVGHGAIDGILAARRAGGAFRDLFDFCRRIDLRKANKRVMEALVRAGALDQIGPNRATLMMQLPLALKMAEQHHQTQQAGMQDLFGMHESQAPDAPDQQLLPTADNEWEDEQRLQAEKETLGLYLTGHPIDRFEREVEQMVSARIAGLLSESMDGGAPGARRRGGRKITLAGLVMEARHRNTPRGRMASVQLDDRTGRMEVAVFSDLYETCCDSLSVDKVLVISGSLSYDEYRGALSVRADRVYDIEQARAAFAERLQIRFDARQLAAGASELGLLVEQLRTLLQAYRGGHCAVALEYWRADAAGMLRFGDAWRVRPAEQLLKQLRGLLGSDAVKIIYGRMTAEAMAPQVAFG